MASNDYFDDEYFQVQNFLAILSDTLPKIDLDSIPDMNTLLGALVNQNKAYGKKIISLYETLDTVYKSNNAVEASPEMGSPDFNSKLHQKIMDYEELVTKLKAENEGFSTQIRQLSQQIESLHPKNQQNLGNTSDPKKSGTFSTFSSSPAPKGSGNGTASREVSLELENMFMNAEYKKAVELLTQIDYKKPYGMAPEKFNNWLTIANRLKDASFNEILNKVKILLTFADKGEEEEDAPVGLDDSLDNPAHSTAEKIYLLLDEKIPKVILRSEYTIETQKAKIRQSGGLEEQLRASKNKSEGTDESQLTNEQLRMKVYYLNAKVEQMERALHEKDGEIDYAKGKIRSLETFGEQEDSYRRFDHHTNRELQEEIEKRLKLESQARELIEAYEDLKDKYEGLEKDIADSENRCQELTDQLKDNGDYIEKLIQENADLKEQFEFSEKHEDLEKMKELLQEKDSKIKYLSEELTLLGEYQRSPGNSPTKNLHNISITSKDGRSNQAIDIAVQNQTTIINSVKQMLGDLRVPITETLKSLNMDYPTKRNFHDKLEEQEDEANEAQKSLKANITNLREIQSEVSFVKSAVGNLCDVVSNDFQFVSDKLSLLGKKVSQAEEKLFENLSNSIQIVSQMTSLLSETSPSQLAGQMPQIHNLLQNLHANVQSTIQDYPDFSRDVGGSQSPFKELQGRSQNLSNSFKDMLMKDQSELKTRLKSTIQNIGSFQTNEVYSKLYQEIEKTQELQDQNEAKDLAIKRLGLIFNEGIDRSMRSLEQLVKLADSEEAQGLLEFVLDEVGVIKRKLKEIAESTKGPGYRLDEAISKIEDEFEIQRKTWIQVNRDLEEGCDRKIKQFIREIEGEREAHEQTRDKLESALHDLAVAEKSSELRKEIQILKERLREKEMDLERNERENEELRRKVKEMGREREGILGQIDKLQLEMSHIGIEKGKLREDLLRSGGEKEEIRRSLEDIIREVETLRRTTSHKNSEIEALRDQIRIRTEENEMLRVELGKLKNGLEGLENLLDEVKNENKNLVQQLNEAFDKRQQEVEPMRRKIEYLERENGELKDYRGSTEIILKKTQEQVDHLKLTYFTDVNELKEENKTLLAQKKNWGGDLDRKTQEVSKLNHMLDSLQDFSNKQIEILKEKEEKLSILTAQKREADQYIRELERRMEDLNEKNRKYTDSMSQNSHDVQTLKEELHRIMEKQVGLQRDLAVSREKNEDLVRENQRLAETREEFASSKGAIEDKMRKVNEIMQITKNELRNCKELLEEKNKELAHKEKELQILKEASLREREGFSQSDLIGRLKRELEARNDEITELKRDFRKNLEKIEKLNIEMDTMRAASRIGEQNNREIDRVTELNRTISVENETLRKSIRQRDDQYSMERENYERELQLTKKKINDLQNILNSKDKQMNSIPKSLPDSLKSTGMGSSSYYSSLIEGKDLEIKRLTQIVKNLTENLRDTQESKYKLRK